MNRYRPIPSFGWLWWLLMGLLVAASALPVLVLPTDEPIPWWVDVMMWPIVAMGLFFVLIALMYPMMSYELEPAALVASYGPLLTYRIPYADVTDLHFEDLRWSMWSSMRLPGLALYGVPYPGRGTIKMCSTRSSKGVLVIETLKGPYGISPLEHDRFVDELNSRVRGAREA